MKSANDSQVWLTFYEHQVAKAKAEAKADGGDNNSRQSRSINRRKGS